MSGFSTPFINDAATNGSNMSAQSQGIVNVGTSPTLGVGGRELTAGTVPTPDVPGAGGAVGAQQGTGWWGEHGKANTLIGGVQVLGSLWNSFQSHKMAKEQMKFAREQWDTNLGMQTQTYNTALKDRVQAQHFTEGKSQAETDAYVQENSL